MLLAGLGASGLLHGQGRTAADVVWLAGDSEWTRLDEREATLHQRRQAESSWVRSLELSSPVITGAVRILTN